MKIVLDKEKSEAMDEAFASLKESKNNSAAVAKIRRNLKAIFQDKDIDVTIVDNKGPMFIMSVFPEENTINDIIRAIVDERGDEAIRKAWNSTNKWTVEIDSKVLTDKDLAATPKEMTALLLHEMGHIVYSNSVPQRLSRVMRLEYARCNVGIKTALKDKLLGTVLKLPILNACTYDNYKTKDNIKKELQADVFVVKSGYGDELNSVLEKLIARSKDSKSEEVNQTPQNVYGDLHDMTMFAIHTVEDLQKRQQNVVKENFKKLLLSSPSKFIQKAINAISTAVIKGGSGAVTESVVAARIDKIFKDAEDSVLKSYLEDSPYMIEAVRQKTLKRIDPAMIAYVEIEKNNIRNNDDKMMLVSYIYSKLDLIDYYISIIDNNIPKYIVPHSKQSLIEMKQQLLRIKDEIIAYQIPEVKYGVYLGDYPAGYEG